LIGEILSHVVSVDWLFVNSLVRQKGDCSAVDEVNNTGVVVYNRLAFEIHRDIDIHFAAET